MDHIVTALLFGLPFRVLTQILNLKSEALRKRRVGWPITTSMLSSVMRRNNQPIIKTLATRHRQPAGKLLATCNDITSRHFFLLLAKAMLEPNTPRKSESPLGVQLALRVRPWISIPLGLSLVVVLVGLLRFDLSSQPVYLLELMTFLLF